MNTWQEIVPEMHDKAYVVTVSREQMRRVAAYRGYLLTDEQCDELAGYLDEDAFDDLSFDHYLNCDMISGHLFEKED